MLVSLPAHSALLDSQASVWCTQNLHHGISIIAIIGKVTVNVIVTSNVSDTSSSATGAQNEKWPDFKSVRFPIGCFSSRLGLQ